MHTDLSLPIGILVVATAYGLCNLIHYVKMQVVLRRLKIK